MNLKKMKIGFLFIAWCYTGITVGYAQDGPKRYVATYKSNSTIQVDGKLDKLEWKDVKKESDFTFPWLKQNAPATDFFAMVDTLYFNFAFRVKDKDIVVKKFTKESDVAEGDRVELFFAKNKELKEYYCLEISPNANVLDYKASFHRQFDDSWNLQGLQVASKIEKEGYVVEGRIPITALKSLGVINGVEKGSCFLIGLYRAEYSAVHSGMPEVKWISWVRPDTVEPDFHVPSSFGLFCIGPK